MDGEIIWPSGAANYFLNIAFRSGVQCFDWYRFSNCRLFRNVYVSDNVCRVLGDMDVKLGKDGKQGVEEATGTLPPLYS